MLRSLLYRFFGRAKKPSVPEPERLAYQVNGMTPAEPLPPHTVACVLRRGELATTSRDNVPEMQDGEVCWLLPAEDVALPVTLDVADQRVAADIAVRFEADLSIAALLRDREQLTRDDLAGLVTSELAGLLDMLGHDTAGALLELDDLSRERLRAKLSLLLQTKGLRCTGLCPFCTAPAEEPALVEETKAAAPTEAVPAEPLGRSG